MSRVIFTVFAGRRANLEILLLYLQRALELQLVHEVHLWNFTRNEEDEHFLKTVGNLRRSSSSKGGRYIEIAPRIHRDSGKAGQEIDFFELDVCASNDIHVRICERANADYPSCKGDGPCKGTVHVKGTRWCWGAGPTQSP